MKFTIFAIIMSVLSMNIQAQVKPKQKLNLQQVKLMQEIASQAEAMYLKQEEIAIRASAKIGSNKDPEFIHKALQRAKEEVLMDHAVRIQLKKLNDQKVAKEVECNILEPKVVTPTKAVSQASAVKDKAEKVEVPVKEGVHSKGF